MKTKLRLLHLEDTATDAELVERGLKKGNIDFEKLVVSNKADFEKALINFNPEIVLADHTLPSFDSLEAIKIIKQSGLEIPIILVSATVSDEFAVDVMKAGAEDYILKDRLHRLPKAVLNALEKFSLERAKKANIDELIRSQFQLKEAQAIAKLGSWETDLQTYKVNWSDEIHRIFETDAATFQVTHEAFLQFVHPEDRAKINESFKNSINSKAINSIEHRILTPKGNLKYVIEKWRIFQDDNGHPVRALGTCQDITEQKIVEKEITKLSLVARKTSNAVIITDAEETIEWVNDAFTQMTGFELNEVMGKRPSAFLQGPETNPEVVSYMRRKISKNQAFQCDIINYSKLRKKYWTNIKCQPEFDATGKLTGYFSVQTDITEKKRLEKAVETERDQFFEIFSKAPSAIGMLRGASHVFEMANPLYLKITGRKDIIGKTVAEAFPEVIEQGFVDRLDHVYQTGEAYSGTEVLIKLDLEGIGELTDFYMDYIYQAYRNSEGEIEGVIFFHNDITKQVLSRKKIEESEKQYRQIVETAQEGIWKIDEHNKTTFVNQKLCEIFGYTKDEILGKEIYNFMDEEGKQIAEKLIQDRQSGKQGNHDFKFISKSGKEIWTSVSANPIFNDEGNYKGSLAMLSDITEKRKLEAVLEKSNRLARIGSWEIDLENGTVFWSDITKEIHEVDPDFVPDISAGIGNYSEGENKKIITQRLSQCIDKGIPWDEELELTTFKGNVKWVRTLGEAEFVNGKCVKVYGSLQDVTERKNAVEKLISSKTKLNIAQQIAQIGSYEVNMLTKEQSWSDEFYRILGLNKDVIPSREKFLLFVHPHDRDMAVRIMEDSLSTHADSSFQFRFIRKNGETGYASSEWKFEFDPHHNPLHIHGILRDLTQAKKIESERAKMISDIVQRNSDLEQFSYIVSHNLRAPVANILGLGELLEQEDYTPEVKNNFLEALLDNVKRLDVVISDLNSILQVRGNLATKKEKVILNELVDSIKGSIQNLIEKEKAEITINFDVPAIHTVQSYLHSIFYNLIVNSIKYSKPGMPPQIVIRSELKERSVVLTFEDNGLGIDLVKKREEVFGLYKRFHGHIEGKGMGLFLVKTQVELLGGKISIESKVNAGTKFTITMEKQL